MTASFAHSIARALAPLLALLATLVLIAPGLLAAQPPPGGGGPVVTITPNDSVFDRRNGGTADTVVSVAILWCHSKPFDVATRVIELDGVDVRSSFTHSGDGYAGHGSCSTTYGHRSTGTVTLTRSNEGQHQLLARIEDFDGYLGEDFVIYQYLWAGYIGPNYALSVSADAPTQFRAPSTPGLTAAFTVANTGNRPDTLVLTPVCTRAASGCALSGTAGRVFFDTLPSASQTRSVTVSYSTGATPGDTGLVTLRVASAKYASVNDSATTYAMLHPAEASRSAGVVIPLPARVLERDLCVTVSAGDGAASECGDLRLVHGLPGIRTYGAMRALTLSYSSQHASPAVIVPLEITLGTAADSVVAELKQGTTVVGRGSWKGGDWTATDKPRRVGVPLTSALATGVYTLSAVVSRYSGTTPSQVGTPPTVQLPVVDRSASPYGRGWWVSGVEQLDVATKVWVGGDGSVRQYLATADPTVWLADVVDRPDTLKRIGAHYVRLLPNRLRIRFDTITGEHVETENRFGRVTRFYYGTAAGQRALDSVTVPVPGSTRKFRFVRGTGGYVTSVESPGIGPARVTQLAIDSEGRLTQITDPDTTTVSFRYDSSASSGSTRYRVVKRTDRRGTPRTFSYTSGRLTGFVQRLGGGASATSTFRPVELVGLPTGALGAAQPLDSAYASIDGSRTDVADVTRIWVNAHGAPIKVRNALGRDVTITYSDTFPALPKETKAVSGLVTKAGYNARGLVTSVQVMNPFGDGKSPVTRYAWNTTWAQPDSITAPTGVVTTFGYDTLGNVAWQQVGPDSVRRVRARYHSDGLYRESTVPGTLALDSASYDPVLRNPSAYRDRVGTVTSMLTDSLGRVRRTTTPIRTGKARVDSMTYDAADRVVWTRSVGPDMSYTSPKFNVPRSVPAETLFVTTEYDNEGAPTAVRRLAAGPNSITQDSVATVFSYDSAGRKTQEFEKSRAQSFGYDAAGNLVSHAAGLGTVTMTYDALGRLVRKVLPAVSNSGTTCMATFYPDYANCDYNFKFPLFSAGSSLLVAGDTVVFGYDAAGNQTRADNRHARVRRSYAPNGALLTDTLRIRTVRYETEQHMVGSSGDPNGFETHAFLLRYQYDSTSRLTALTYPSQLCTSCTASYAYHDTTGALKRLTDPWANVIDFWHGAAGMLDSAGYPGSVRERVTYDAEGRVTLRSVKLTGGYPVIDDSLGYDPVGRIDGGHTYAARARRLRGLRNFYSGLGALAATEQSFTDGSDPKGEEFRNDALGNRTYSEKTNFSFSYEANPARRQNRYDADFRLEESYAVTASGARDELGYWESSVYTYSLPGHLRFKGYIRVPHVEGVPPQWWQEASYYQADGKLAVFERHDGQGTMESLGGPLTGKGLREEYRYDALGRRVLVWARRGAACTDSNTGCESTVRRAIWAGEQLVYETRGKAADSVSSSDLENEAPSGDGERGQPKAYGEVGYAHAGGIDHPLVVHRASTGTTFFPHTNWRGLYDGATNPAGQLIPCYGSNPAPCANVPDIDWPGSETSVFIGATPSSRVNPAEWAGSLVTEQADASGLLYRRNRYYDPASGRFTQPDPIGLAGGLNTYGFANGDPITYSDPFGLCPMCMGALAGVATRYVLAAVTGAEYTLKDAAVDAALGAAGAGIISKLDKLNDLRKVTKVADDLPAPKVGSQGGPGAGKDFPASVKDAARAESGNKCVFCKVETTRSKTPHPQRSNIDHAIPKSRGGNNTLQNAQNTCQTCNLRKVDRTTEEFLKTGRQ